MPADMRISGSRAASLDLMRDELVLRFCSVSRRGECFQVQEYQVDFCPAEYVLLRGTEVYLVQYEY